MQQKSMGFGFSFCALIGALLAFSTALSATNFQVEKHLRDIKGEERLGAQIPLDLKFVNAEGESVVLGDYFKEGRAVLLSFNYSDCPGLCNLQLGNLAVAFGKMDLKLGVDFVTISIALPPEEPIDRLKRSKDRYLEEAGYSEQGDGWHFLASAENNAERLATAVGYKFKRVEEDGNVNYAHHPWLIFLTPKGKVAQYFYSPDYNDEIQSSADKPLTGNEEYTFEALKESILRTSKGLVISKELQDKVKVFGAGCLIVETTENGQVALNFMKIAGIVIILALAGFLSFMWIKHSK